MGLSFRKRIKINDDTFLNVSKSGVSITKKIGNVSINTKRGTTVNLGQGVTYHIPKNSSNQKKASKQNKKNK